MWNKSVIENHGRLHVENILGVPQNQGQGHDNMSHTSNASLNRWFDNYSHRIDGGLLHIRGFRFGGEREGITAVVNYAPYVCETIQSTWEEQMCGRVDRGGRALPQSMRGAVGSSIIIEQSEFSGSDLAKIYSAEIVLEEIPMQLVVKDCLTRSLVNSGTPMALVSVSPDIDLDGAYVRAADTVRTSTGVARPVGQAPPCCTRFLTEFSPRTRLSAAEVWGAHMGVHLAECQKCARGAHLTQRCLPSRSPHTGQRFRSS